MLVGGICEAPYLDTNGSQIRASLPESGSVDAVERHVWEDIAKAGEQS